MRRGFTLVEGVTVLLAAGMLLSYFSIAALPRSREMANRGTCAANLRGLMQSMMVYASSENDWLPCQPPPGSATSYDAGFKTDAPQQSAPDGPRERSASSDNRRSASPVAGIWMMATNNSVAPKQFLCKSDPFASKPAALSPAPAAGPNAANMYPNFQDEKNLSYSVAYPWTLDAKGAVIVSPIWRNNTDASLPIISDMAPYEGSKAKPGEPATRPAGSDPSKPVDPAWAVTKANSQNHQFDGQNVVFDDCHVDFTRVPTVGQNSDSIWGIHKRADWLANHVPDPTEIPIEAGTLPHPPTGAPGMWDIVMVPTRDATGHLK